MHRFLPYALFAGLSAILGHVAFYTLEDLGDGNRLIAWLKIAAVFGAAYLLLTRTALERRFNSPTWVWVCFGAFGSIGTLIVIAHLGKYVTLAIGILVFPLHMLGLTALFPILHIALLPLLLMIVNDLRRADEVDG